MRAIKYTCIVGTPYALSLYFLRMDDDAISQTRFFVGRTLPGDVFTRLPHAIRLDVDERLSRSRLYRVYFRLKCLLIHWLYVVGTQVFAQDHVFCAAPLICRMNYTLIEDGPGFYSWNPPVPAIESAFVRFWLWALNGAIYLKHFGRNQQCENRWTTSADDVKCYKEEGLRYERFDVASLWKSASEGKRCAVFRLFGDLSGGEGVVAQTRLCRTILLTQPLVEDCGLSSEEVVAVYRSSIETYRGTGIVIKPHPRDKFDYESVFPDCKVLKTRIPMQLLCAFGVRFERVITPFSTAVSEFPEDTEIVWLGSAGNKKIEAICGNPAPPKKFSKIVRIS